ncbi:unnamed protein product [Linum trigynum]|uniref:Uncharacterized protein n=1 Tax=Linum trigynum TaxID=586398 RepID=A0AAV2E8P4_9ROSI
MPGLQRLVYFYTKDFGIECCVGRFHNIHGPFGTVKWQGKRTSCLLPKGAYASDKFEMWGDALQTRSSPSLMNVWKVCSGKYLRSPLRLS